MIDKGFFICDQWGNSAYIMAHSHAASDITSILRQRQDEVISLHANKKQCAKTFSHYNATETEDDFLQALAKFIYDNGITYSANFKITKPEKEGGT